MTAVESDVSDSATTGRRRAAVGDRERLLKVLPWISSPILLLLLGTWQFTVSVIGVGFGTTSKIIMAAILAFFPIMLNVMLGVRPYVFAGPEVAIVLAVIGAIVGEYLGGSEGLGHLVVTSLNAPDAPQLFEVVILLAVMGSLLYLAVTTAKRLVIPGHDSVAGQQQ